MDLNQSNWFRVLNWIYISNWFWLGVVYIELCVLVDNSVFCIKTNFILCCFLNRLQYTYACGASGRLDATLATRKIMHGGFTAQCTWVSSIKRWRTGRHIL